MNNIALEHAGPSNLQTYHPFCSQIKGFTLPLETGKTVISIEQRMVLCVQ